MALEALVGITARPHPGPLPRERETISWPLWCDDPARILPRCRMASPSPSGEGWGEGIPRKVLQIKAWIIRLTQGCLTGLLLLPLLFVVVASSSYAQGQSAATQDPMMQLMLAQPKIDVDSPVVPQASFDPPAVRPGEAAMYRVTLNALETAVDWPETIPIPAGVTWRVGARGQILTLGGALLVPRTTFNYRVRTSQPGEIIIPEFTIAVNGKPVKIPAARLEVTDTPPAGLPPLQLILQVPTNGLFVGQSIRARVMLPGSPGGGALQSLTQVQINGQGFVVDQASARAHIETLPIPGTRATVSAFAYELMLTPIAVGKLSVFAQGYAVGNRVIGGVIMPGPGGPLTQWTLVDSPPSGTRCPAIAPWKRTARIHRRGWDLLG